MVLGRMHIETAARSWKRLNEIVLLNVWSFAWSLVACVSKGPLDLENGSMKSSYSGPSHGPWPHVYRNGRLILKMAQ